MEKLITTIVWMLPKKIVYWCAIRVATYKCEGNPGDQTFNEALGRFTSA